MDYPYSNNELFKCVYAEYYGKIHSYCLKRLNGRYDIAQDCVQNTFFSAFQNIETLSVHENVGGWMFKTAKNYVHQAIRQLKREQSMVHIDDLDIFLPSNENIVQQIEDKDFCVDISCADILLSLTENERLLHELFYRDGLCAAEIAEKLCISENACRIRLYRLRKKIYDKVRKTVGN